jgi:thiamine-monophosphate kinase
LGFLLLLYQIVKQKGMAQTALSELGEFGLIDRLTKAFPIGNTSTKLGIGDDCAIVSYPDKMDIVVTTDLLMEGIHFDLMYCPLKHLGYKAVMVNLSDIYAMNAKPKQITVSIAVSAKFSVEALEELYEGIALACKNHSVDLIGGDTSSSLTGMTISITALGEVKKDKAVKRSGAKPNDLICVSGDLGGAYLGLQILEREKHVYTTTGSESPKLEGYDYVLEKQLKPEARKDIIERLAKYKVMPTAMIDVSDGLSSELLHICKCSQVGCKVYTDKIPVNVDTAKVANEFSIDSLTAALSGGEDYELLFTVSIEDFHKVSMVTDVKIIGSITAAEEGAHLITNQGEKIVLVAQGWNGFKK